MSGSESSESVMRLERKLLFWMVVLCIIKSKVSMAALGDGCSDDNRCTDSENHVCDTVTRQCKVKANGVATNCTGSDSNCPWDAICTDSTCSCKTGFEEDAGLCARILRKPCTKTSECSTSLPNSFCDIVPPCPKGQCTCKPPRTGDDCLSLGYGETCETGTDKDKCADTRRYACNSTTLKCDCATDDLTYKKTIFRCTDKKLLGETCSDVSDCYVGTRSGGVCKDGKCACESGYLEETSSPGSQACRLPFAGETGCDSTCMAYPSPASQVAPTCTNKKCSCSDSNATQTSAPYRAVCVNYCIADLDSETPEKDDGAQCSAFNECKSKLCLKCPGDEQTMCYRASCHTSNGMKVSASGLALGISMILYTCLY